MNNVRLIINLALLEKQPVELTSEFPADFLGVKPSSSLAVTTAISCRVRAELLTGGSVLVRGSFHYGVAGVCGRCLKEVTKEIEKDDFYLDYEAEELPREELDVTEDVREEAAICLPYNLLCSDDCRGLCPKCGKDLNEGACACPETPEAESLAGDSPWSALDKLK